LKCARHLHTLTKSKNLVMAGGVALNCVGNGRVLREGPFENLWIQPAAGDAGGAVGAAYAAWHEMEEQPRRVCCGKDAMRGAYLGPEFDNSEVEGVLQKIGATYEKLDE